MSLFQRRPKPVLTEIMPGLYAFKHLRRSRWVEFKVNWQSRKISRALRREASQQEEKE